MTKIYYYEKNYDLAYQYALKSLHSVKETEFSVPKFLKIIAAIIIKIFRLSLPFREIRKETDDLDQSRNKWVKWATGYKDWYEKNIQDTDSPN